MADFDLDAYFANQTQNAPDLDTALGAVTRRQQEVAQAKTAAAQSLQQASERKAIEMNGLVASFGVGSGRLVENFGILTGGYDSAARQFGQDVADYWEQRKPNTLLVREDQRRQAIEGQDSEWGKAGVAFWETVTDPSLLGALMTETVPSLAAGGVAGRVVGAGAKLAGAGEKVVNRLATGAALTEAGAEQGASVAGETYDELLRLPEELWAQNPEYSQLVQRLGAQGAKETIAKRLATRAGLASGAVSLASQKLPGGARLEKALAGTSSRSASVLGNVAKGFAGEAAQEVIEEGSGTVIGNVAKQAIDPEQVITEGLGESAGLAAAAGGALGGVTGATDTRIDEPDLPETENKEAIEKAAIEAAGTGNVDPLLDPESESYAPTVAADTLIQRAQDTELLPEEREAAKTKLAEVQETLAKELEEARAELEAPLEVDKAVEERQAEMEASRKRLAIAREEVISNDQLTEEQRQSELADIDAIAAEVGLVEEGAQESTESIVRNEQRKRTQRVAKLEQNITQIKGLVEQQRQEARPKTAEINDLVAKTEATTPSPERDTAVQEVISLGMRDPGAIDPDTAERLSKNKSLPAEARKMFQAFTAANAAANSAKDVGSVRANVLDGGPGFKGLSEYRTEVGQALEGNNREQAVGRLKELKAFLDGHQAKRQAYGKLIKDVREGKIKTGFLIRDPEAESGWRQTTKAPWKTEQERAENGGLFVSNSKKGVEQALNLFEAMKYEVQAIEETGKQLGAAVRLADTTPIAGQETTTPSEPEVASQDDAFYAELAALENARSEESAEPFVEEPTPETPTTAPPAAPEAQATADADVAEETTEAQDTDEATDDAPLTDKKRQDGNYLKQSDFDRQTDKEKAPDDPINFIKRYFTIKRGTKGSSAYPLSYTPSFFQKLLANGELDLGVFNQLLGRETTKQPSPAELQHLVDFAAFHDQVAPLIKSNIERGVPKRPGFGYRDLPQNLRDDAGNVADNVVTALAYGAFNFLMTKGQGSRNSHEQINDILNRDPLTPVTPDEQLRYEFVGTRRSQAERAIGRDVRQMLQLESLDNAPSNLDTALEAGLGVQALAPLLSQGYMGLSQDAINVSPDPEKVDVVPQQFVSAPNRGSSARAAIDAWVPSYRDSNGVIATLLSKPIDTVLPNDEPGFNQTQIRNSDKGLPAKLKKAVAAYSARPWKLRQTFNKLVADNFTPKQQIFLAGGEARKFHHKVLKQSRQESNEALGREITNLAAFAERGDTPFFVEGLVWSQQRVGSRSTLVDPQGNKAQRWSMALEEWRTTVDLADEAKVNLFKIAVAQGLGISVGDLQQAKALEKLDALVQEAPFRAAIAALQSGKLDDAGKTAVMLAVRDADEGMHSLHALHEYARFTQAKGSFTTDIAIEVDGVANGPGLTMAQTGSLQPGFGAMFGFFTQADNATDFPAWKAQGGNLDVYERVAARVIEAAPENADIWFGKEPGESTISSASRKMFKNLLTPIMFGASESRAIQAMADAAITALYTNLEKRANGPGSEADIVADMNARIARFNKAAGFIAMPQGNNIAQIMNTEITPSNREAFATQYRFTVGVAIEDAMQQEIGAFLQYRNVLNETANALYSRYMAAYDFLYNQQLKKRVEAGQIATRVVNGVKQPIQDLGKQDLEDIRKALAPLALSVDTALSQGENNGQSRDKGESLKVGVNLERIFFEAARDQEAYVQEVQVGDKEKPGSVGFPHQGVSDGTDASPRKSRTLYASKQVRKEPGARLMPILVHALDSAISSSVYATMPSLNVHDAHMTGIEHIEETAKALNAETWKWLKSYSIPRVLFDLKNRSVRNAKQVINQNPGIEEAMNSAMVERRERTLKATKQGQLYYGTDVSEWTVNDVLAETEQTLLRMDLRRNEFLASLSHINQYGWEGAAYAVPADQKAQVETRIREVRGELDRAAIAGADGQPPAPTPTKPSEAKQRPAQSRPEESYWGARGRPLRNNVPGLVKLFSKDTEQSVKTVLPVLRRAIDSMAVTEKQRKFLRALVTEMNKSLDPNLRIYTVNDKDLGERGRYRLNPNSEGIQLNTAQSQDSGMNVETLIHELVHATTAGAVFDYLNNDGKNLTPVQRNAAANLVELYNQAEAFVNADPALQEKWGYSVSSIDEMLAYGLTNVDFQTEVLGQIEMQQQDFRSVAGLRNGLRSFIQNIRDLLFGQKANDRLYNGVSVMIINAPVLFSQSSALYEAARQGREATIDLGMAANDPMRFTSAQIFEALGANPNATDVADPVHAEQLRHVLERVVSVVYDGDNAFRAENLNIAPATPEDVFLQAKATGQIPFAAEAAINLRTNDQEAFVLESTELAVKQALKNAPFALKSDLSKVFKEAKQFVKPADLPPGEYDFLFDTRNNRDEYLPRFVAAALAYKPLREKLHEGSFAGITELVADQDTLGDKIQLLFQKLLEFLHQRVLTGLAKGQRYDVAVGSLAQRLATVEARYQSTLSRRAMGARSMSNRLDNLAKNGTEKMQLAVASLGNASLLRNSRSGIVKGGAAAVAAIAGDNANNVIDYVVKIRNQMSEGRYGIIRTILNELRIENDTNGLFYRMLIAGNTLEQTVKRTKDAVKRRVDGFFEEKLTKKESEAVTALVRTDISALLRPNGLDIQDIHDLLVSPSKLRKQISDYEQRLQARLNNSNQSDLYHYYQRQSKALGYFMNTGAAKSDFLVLNAYNIVTMQGTPQQGNVRAETVNDLVQEVDELTSLYALQYMKDTDKQQAAAVIAKEQRRSDENPNGVDQVLRQYKLLQDDAKTVEFAANPQSMIKGYTRDIYNPHIDATVAPVGSTEAANLEAAGYTAVHKPLPADPADSTGVRRQLYVLRGRGLTDAITGVLGPLSKTQRGSVQKTNRQVKARQIDNLFRPAPNWNPATDNRENRLVPVLGNDGRVKQYRYMMEAETRDSVLERNSEIGKVLGQLAGHAVNKLERPLLNAEAIKAIHATYKAEYALNPESFLNVSPDSADAQIAERMKLLPAETRQLIRDTWGSNDMYVRKDLYDLLFGYRKASIGDIFAKNALDRKWHERMLVGILENVWVRKDGKWAPLGARAATKAVQAEDMWQEIVRMVKDIWVIRNLVTLIGNEMSNISLLMLRGVPIQKILSYRIEAWRNTGQYRADQKERDELQAQLDMADNITSPQLRAEMEQDIARLTADMQANPVHELMEAGMYQTLVEDITTEDDPYSYQSRLQEDTARYTDKIPGPIKDAGNWLMLNHNTWGYKALNHATIMSDFAARYTLHKHQTSPLNRNPVSSEESLRIARAAFVNYDVPTHRGLQYLNDMGILPFTKYYLRIQAALIDAVRSNPGRAAMVYVLGDLLDIQTILDSSLAVDPLPGRLSAGAFELPGAIPEIATFKGVGNLID